MYLGVAQSPHLTVSWCICQKRFLVLVLVVWVGGEKRIDDGDSAVGCDKTFATEISNYRFGSLCGARRHPGDTQMCTHITHIYTHNSFAFVT